VDPAEGDGFYGGVETRATGPKCLIPGWRMSSISGSRTRDLGGTRPVHPHGYRGWRTPLAWSSFSNPLWLVFP